MKIYIITIIIIFKSIQKNTKIAQDDRQRLQIGQDNKICQVYGLNIKCWRDDKEIYSGKLNPIVSSITIGQFHYCVTSGYGIQSKLDCHSFQTDIQDQRINYNELSLQSINNAVSGSNFLCVNLNDNILHCQGSRSIIDGIPLELSLHNSNFSVHINYFIEEIISNDFNICVFQSNLKTNEYLMKCWGSEETGINEVPSNLVLSWDSIKVWAMGANTTCIFINNSTLHHCWGKCPNDLCSIPLILKDDLNEVSIGYNHACAIQDETIHFNKKLSSVVISGSLLCWGGNDQGQTIIPLHQEKQVSHVKAGVQITCGLKSNFEALCWGKNLLHFQEISQVMLSISAGGRHTCGVLFGHQECWGNAEQGQTNLIDATYHTSYHIATGWDQTCYQGVNQEVKCVGFNFYGQADVSEEIGKDIDELKAGLSHTCAIQNNINSYKKLACWGGLNEFGEHIENIGNYQGITQVSLGHDFTCISYEQNGFNLEQIKCFGNNKKSQCDLPFNEIINLRSMESGGEHTCIIEQNDGYLLISCWGGDSQGQSTVPSELANSAFLSLGDQCSCVIDYNNRVRCWGEVYFNTENNLQISYLSVNYEYYCFINEDDKSARCLGDNEWGQCDVPTQRFQAITIQMNEDTNSFNSIIN